MSAIPVPRNSLVVLSTGNVSLTMFLQESYPPTMLLRVSTPLPSISLALFLPSSLPTPNFSLFLLYRAVILSLFKHHQLQGCPDTLFLITGSLRHFPKQKNNLSQKKRLILPLLWSICSNSASSKNTIDFLLFNT